MAFHGQRQTDGFEDQLRRMVLIDNGPPASPSNSTQFNQPTVRLPPAGSYFNQQPANGNVAAQVPNEAAGTWHARNASSPQNQFIPGQGPPSPAVPNANRADPSRSHYAPHLRSQQQNRGFPPMQSPRYSGPGPQQRSRYQQAMPIDPNAFHRGGFDRPFAGRGRGRASHHLFNPNLPQRAPVMSHMDRQTRQAQYLEQVASVEVRNVEMSSEEREEKEGFRLALEKLCHEVCTANPERIPSISLEPFGSFQSGFATAGSDMDLVIVVKDKDSTSACFSLLEDDLPRALERKLLEVSYGARLLTRTRVPILKVCEKPEGSFLDKLREERWKWDDLPNEQKYPHLHPREEDVEEDIPADDPNAPITTVPVGDPNAPIDSVISTPNTAAGPHDEALSPTPNTNTDVEPQHLQSVRPTPPPEATTGAQQPDEVSNASQQTPRVDTRREEKIWTRERKAGPLDFPKMGVGIQSDINFFNPLGMHNTQLLRCYSLCDHRVRPMVLFVKAWAKKRKINSSYSGTLSSYGYVLMVLHYLMNVANPPVLPNLQGQGVHQTGLGEVVDGYVVRFWRNEDDITAAAQRGQITANREPLGSLLNGFFQYYASSSYGVTFRWMQEVLSLRSSGGILAKIDKGWVKAVTEESEGKKVQHRYLFCIEDPFELDHNVARTVTHNGIVAIRDEFRRANRILQAIGNGYTANEGELFADLIEVEDVWKVRAELKKTNGVQNGAVDGSPETQAPKVPEMRHFFADRAEQGGNHHHPNANFHQNPRRGRGRGYGPPSQARALDLHDNEAFPTLGAMKPTKKKAPHAREADEEFSEISGDKAKAHLAEVKRMKDEEQAESTAKGAAEAVLNGID